jgi:sodium transport system permease protein
MVNDFVHNPQFKFHNSQFFRKEIMLSNILNIWRKELMDTVRDRRALIQSLLVPLFLGILYAIINPVLGSIGEAKAEEPLTIPTQGLAYVDEELVTIMADLDITLVAFAGDLATAVSSGDEAAGLIIPEGFSEDIAAERPLEITLLTNPTSGGVFGGGVSASRLNNGFLIYNQAVAARRLAQHQLEPRLISPVILNMENLSTPEQRAGQAASLFLPMLVAIMAVQGGVFVAIDVTAGEKERHTFEALLVTPATDTEIFLGKLLAVFVTSFIPVILTLTGFWAAGNLLPESMTDGAFLPFSVILQAILLTIPLVLAANVILMIISVRTKAFKDAQSATTPLIFGVLIAAMFAAFAPPTETMFFLIPFYGTAAVVGQLAVAGTASAVVVISSIVGNLLMAALGTIAALRLFNRERLLYSM